MVPNPVWVAYNRAANRGRRGVGKAKRQLGALRDFIFEKNALGSNLKDLGG